MTVKDLINQALDKKMTYPEAIEQLKKLRLPEEEQESYELILYKILGKEKEVNHLGTFTLNSVPNELYYEILSDTIKMVRSGMFSPDICQDLFDTYGLGASLISYFVNESISIVRMNTLDPAEIAAIGNAYHKIAVTLMEQGAEMPEPEVDVPEINAQQIADIQMYSDEE
jgi:hypothetical protein